MTAVTLTSEEQITIPATVRASLDIDVGDRVEFIEIESGCYEVIDATHSVKAFNRYYP